MAAFPDRAPNAIVLTAEQIAANPDAPAPTAAQPPPTPDADALPAAAATGAATATRSPHLGVAPPAARGTTSQGGAEPFWATMISPAVSASTTVPGTTSSTGQQHPSTSVLDQTRTGVPTAPAREQVRAIRRLGASHPGGERARRWDLVVVELGCRPCGDELGLLAANLLAPGGVLAVLTHSERRGGRLTDPTGSVVASAQAADLLYLQHIVVLTAPLPATRSGTPPNTGRRPADAQHEPASDAAGEEPAPGNGLMDLLLFLQPGDPNPSSPPDDPLTNVAQPNLPAPSRRPMPPPLPATS